MNEPKLTELDWKLPYADFKFSVRKFIHESQEEDKVIPLPIRIISGETFMAQLAMLVSQVNCDGCNAICCKEDPTGKGIAVLDEDYEIIKAAGYAGSVLQGEDSLYFPCPCPLLVSNRCMAYSSRPFVCICYPFQPGGYGPNKEPLLSVASSCPEGRRIAKDTYLMLWKISNRMTPLKNLYDEGKIKFTGDKICRD